MNCDGGSVFLVQIPDPLGLEAVQRVRALRCLACGGELARLGRSGPGDWVLLYCVGYPPEVVAHLESVRTLLARTEDRIDHAVRKGRMGG